MADRGFVLLVDLVLADLNWQLATAPHTAKADVDLLKRQNALLAADVTRAEAIRKQLPAIDEQCDTFFKQNLPPAESGYSSLIASLGSLTTSAGLRADGFTSHQDVPDKRGVVTVEITTSVNGDYPSVVRFIDGLEHSDTFYVLEGLSLAPDSAGQLKLALQLRTYFRT